jgi:cell division septum initiation protein DivIVA
VDLDRQSIERRDFPIARRGYDPAVVDAHLRALVAQWETLEQQAEENAGGASLGSAAASQVQSILEAAETTAADIERQASEEAAQMRAEATQDAERTRADAIQRAQEHVHAVAQATAVLQSRVEAMDGEVDALVQSLRAGASRLAADLGSVEAEMGALYDAASGRPAVAYEQAPAIPPALEQISPPVSAPAVAAQPATAGPVAVPQPPAPLAPVPPVPPVQAPAAPVSAVAAPAATSSGGAKGDLDGARLVALNMALNGESREGADSFLAENFELTDRAKLLDEVYAAIEG